MSTTKTASVPPCGPEEIEGSKLEKMLLTTAPTIAIKDFLKFCLYVEKIDFAAGLRKSKMAKNSTLGRYRIVSLREQLESSFFR